MKTGLTLGPILFHWTPDRKKDFYARIADEAAVDTVYLGEVICSKRAPFFEPHLIEIAERLERGGKRVVLSSLCDVILPRERAAIAAFVTLSDREIEINDAAGLLDVAGPHRIGPMMNVYNEETLSYLAERGATHFSLVPELPRASIAVLAARAVRHGVGLEVQVFGRASLAVSARCYHARAHGRVKDNCQFVCENDPDGMLLETVSGQSFLAINGIQTLSHTYINLIESVADLAAMGVTHLRLSPHTLDMVAVAELFRGALDGVMTPSEAGHRLRALDPAIPYANGFWHGTAGHREIPASAAS